MFRFEALGKISKYLAFYLRGGLRIRSKTKDIFNHLKHTNKKYEISARITKYCCNSNGNC